MVHVESTHPIHSLEDLAQARAEAVSRQLALQKISLIRVGTATCGAAAGALDTLRAFQQLAQETELVGVLIQETGCQGLCALEPVVEVYLPNQPQVLYGRVTPDIAQQILNEHLLQGKILQEHVIPDGIILSA